jgi:hypothetical protein
VSVGSPRQRRSGRTSNGIPERLEAALQEVALGRIGGTRDGGFVRLGRLGISAEAAEGRHVSSQSSVSPWKGRTSCLTSLDEAAVMR